MRHRRSPSRPVLCSLASPAAPTSPEEDPVQIRLNDLDGALQRIERVLTNQSLLELAQRIDALQAELRTMRGEVEMLQNQSEGGKTQHARLYGDLEKRLAALETVGGVRAAVRAGAGRQRCRLRRTGWRTSRPATTRHSTLLKGGRLPEGDRGFKQFLATYPDQRARRATRSTGSASATTSRATTRSASRRSRRCSTDWPDSRKAPDAMVKIGFYAVRAEATARRAHARRAWCGGIRDTDAAQLATRAPEADAGRSGSDRAGTEATCVRQRAG